MMERFRMNRSDTWEIVSGVEELETRHSIRTVKLLTVKQAVAQIM